MSLFRDPAEHAANPPESWTVVKVADRCWHLRTTHGVVIDRFTTKKAAIAGRTDSFMARLYAQETRWYAGEQVAGWKPYTPAGAR